ncbi:serine hydrolase domain-containing protein [Cytobacillus sp. FJAT-54145]|uniref:Serine hydrolase domain-containing protein n=1 Tax=Cytobacillus spartinae TaxID=3299023 RepID=A0ABW6K645_9BACI
MPEIFTEERFSLKASTNVNADHFKILEKKFTKDKINSCIVSHKGEIVYDYFRNKKLREKEHKINSVTKSVVAILIGIAIDKGIVKGVYQPISDFFPNIDMNKRSITIEHLLTMSMGIDWPEFSTWGGRPMPMINSKDWVRFVLDRKMAEKPGENMYYNSGASHLLAAIIQEASGVSLIQFAENHLFKPLSIEKYMWYSDSKGIGIGGFGLSLKPEDMLKLGQLMLNKGKLGEKLIVSEAWVTAATTPHFLSQYKFGSYGYHWWILNDEKKQPYKPHIYYAMGYGGQYIIVVPEYELVTVFTSDNYSEAYGPLDYFKQDLLVTFEGL